LACQDEGLLVDRAIPHVTACWNRFLGEMTGLAKLPMLLIFLFFGNSLHNIYRKNLTITVGVVKVVPLSSFGHQQQCLIFFYFGLYFFKGAQSFKS
jgi:hypothetical protein